ncbi:MAG: DMT family transporter [Verrucomicrobia bacterium]|nr:DMT family transporter [Verrucomicrobiota bacterium]
MAVSGFCIALQVPINSRLRVAVESPVLSATISFVVGGVLLLLIAALGLLGGMGTGWAGMKTAPVWSYLGGVCGACYVLCAILAISRVGAAVTIASAIFGQQVASLLVDTFGWFGVTRVAPTPTRLLGALLLFAGVLLMQRK